MQRRPRQERTPLNDPDPAVINRPDSSAERKRARDANQILMSDFRGRLIESGNYLTTVFPDPVPLDGQRIVAASDVLKIAQPLFGRNALKVGKIIYREVRIYRGEEVVTDKKRRPPMEPKIKAYSRVFEVLKSLPDGDRILIKTRGGKKRVADKIHNELSDIPLSTIERKLRNLPSGR